MNDTEFARHLNKVWMDHASTSEDPNAAKDAHVMMLAVAMRGLFALGWTSKDVEGVWQQVITTPAVIEFAEQVRCE